MPAKVRELQSMMWAQSIIGIPGVFLAFYIYVLSLGHMPWGVWPLAALPVLTGPLSLLFGTRRRLVRLLAYVIEGISVLVNGYSLLIVLFMGFFGAVHLALGIAVMVKLSKVTMDSWFDR
ncbi:hypothetical protein AB0395_47940 [Streptosporangium sp. NPDC051023]|uniref:hypothetical protein n=1 Tax=Streptosporangium sp. NPDC051023 TaxID=3155410 RepID=UPI00344E716B